MRRIAKQLEIGILALLGSLLLGRAAAGAEAAAKAELPPGLADALEEREYEATRNGRGLQAPNRAHGLRTYFEPTGIRVHDRTAKGGPELLALTLESVGRGEALEPVPPGDVAHAGTRVEIRRPGLVEWYENSDAGLEQGFTLAERPSGRGELALELHVEHARAELMGDRVRFATEAGRSLEYAKLLVVDADGRELSARLEVPAANRLRLVADDTGARYPLVFDPLLIGLSDFYTWSGQEEARLGLSVASAGDVNGDGYADIIASAYLYDGGNSNEGRAWVWYGSATGISETTPPPSTIDANQDDAQLGIRVASAGDVNGDGYADVIVGANLYDSPQLDEGAAFVFHGGPTGIVASASPANADAQLESNQPSAGMGGNVAGIGDVNGDGYGDVAVAAPLYNSGESTEGVVFVFHGSASGIGDGNPLNAAAKLEGDEVGAQFGVGLAGAGDVNGDGYADLIVGAPFFRNPDEGGAFVFHGGASGIASVGSAIANAILESNQTAGGGISPQFGWSVAGAGDVNGDGYSDVIVGALTYDNPSVDEGAAFVFHGSSSGIVASGNPSNANTVLDSNQASGHLGIAVAGAGDVDGDGYADVIVGAFGYDNPTNDEGGAWVFRGGPTGIPSSSVAGAFATPQGPTEWGAQFGVSVAGAGDVNGDGFADVIAGAWLQDLLAPSGGTIFVYHGGNRGVLSGNPATANSLLEQNQGGANFGWGLAGAGDVNGDGYADLIVGAFTYDNGLGAEGAAFVYHGGVNGYSTTPASVLRPNQPGASFGYSVASAGDVNGDGYGDVIVGASGYNDGSNDEGAAFVFHGSASGVVASGSPANANAVLQSNQSDAFLGYEVDGAGDVNGDGYADVIVGAFTYDNPQVDEGAAFVFHGGPGGVIASGHPGNANSVLESNAAGTAMGYSLAGVGDLNGDGYGDVAVGAVYYGTSPALEGAVFVFHGGPGGLVANGNPGNANATFESNQASAGAGSSVAGAGDVNGDGYADLITGATLYDLPEANEGAAFIFHGSSTGIVANASPSNANTTLQANQGSAFLGIVDGAGDVNGDGYGDVIVGAQLYDANAGAAFVFLGGPTGVYSADPTTAAAKLESLFNLYAPQFGSRVAGLGDVNGDGFSDVAVGAREYEHPTPHEGAAFVFYGGGGRTGRPVVARQLRPSQDIPVQPWGLAGSPSLVRIEQRVSHPLGRGWTRLEGEVCPKGVAFGHGTCSEWVSGWNDVGPTNPSVLVQATFFVGSPGTHYHWRARQAYAAFEPSTPPTNPPHGPWRRLLGMATEIDGRASSDFDGDSLPDELDPDDDNDGLSDVDEALAGTNPLDSDSDNDGLVDGEEVAIGTLPLDPDSDDDGICDGGAPVGGCSATEPDNCPLVANVAQTNGDAFFAGDDCQCGDVTGDGTLTPIDYTRARELVAGRTPSGASDPDRCDVTGDAACAVEDLAVLDRAVSGADVDLVYGCPAWSGP